MKSRYCQECLKFRQKKCQGKDRPRSKCKNFEFDVRLYNFPDGSKQTRPETIEVIRERQSERETEQNQQEAFDDFDFGMNLSSSDFANLI